MSKADITDEEIIQLNSQIVRNFGIDSIEAEMIIKSFENFGKKFEELIKMSNIEDNLKILNKFCEYEDAVVLTDNALEEVQDAIQSILAEREQKDKRIQELEEENVTQIMSPYYVRENYIPKQVVIDELKRLNAMLGRTTGERIQKYTINEIIIRSNALQELLEGEK